MSRFRDLARAPVWFVAALFLAPAFAADPPKTLALTPLGVGRAPSAAEIAAWDIDVRPDGVGLPKGHGTVREGEVLFQERCAACHGEFGEGAARWPELAGGQGTLTSDRPLKTIGSFWPNLSAVFDYVRRAMPFGNGQSLTPNELYAVTAYLLNLNDIVKDENFELNERNFTTVHLPNASGFLDDDREKTERLFWRKDVCMTNCKPEVHVTGRAAVLNVTPDAKTAAKME